MLHCSFERLSQDLVGAALVADQGAHKGRPYGDLAVTNQLTFVINWSVAPFQLRGELQSLPQVVSSPSG
jgi:hypothetical protein